jgi:hypothetical protein
VELPRQIEFELATIVGVGHCAFVVLANTNKINKLR